MLYLEIIYKLCDLLEDLWKDFIQAGINNYQKFFFICIPLHVAVVEQLLCKQFFIVRYCYLALRSGAYLRSLLCMIINSSAATCNLFGLKQNVSALKFEYIATSLGLFCQVKGLLVELYLSLLWNNSITWLQYSRNWHCRPDSVSYGSIAVRWWTVPVVIKFVNLVSRQKLKIVLMFAADFLNVIQHSISTIKALSTGMCWIGYVFTIQTVDHYT